MIFNNAIYSADSGYNTIRVNRDDADISHVLIGTDEADHIQGTKADNQILGLDGDDGDDDLFGEAGNDDQNRSLTS